MRLPVLVPTLLTLCAAAPLAAVDSTTAATVIVTAQRSTESLERSTAAASVITAADQAERGHPTALREDVRGLPGVSTIGTGNVDGGIANIRIRGAAASDTLYLVDGIPVTDPSSTQGDPNSSTILPGVTDRIEVVRGSQSGLYGSRAVGGVVNAMTARPTATHDGHVLVEGGSFGTARAEASATGPLGKMFGYAVSAEGLHSDGLSSLADPNTPGRSGDYERDAVDRVGGTARVEAHPTTSSSLYVAGSGGVVQQEFDSFGLPDDEVSNQESRTWRASGGGSVDLGDRATLSLDAAHTDLDRDYTYVGFTGPSTSAYDSGANYVAARATGHLIADKDSWLRRVDLTLGADWNGSQATVNDGFDAFSADDHLTGVYLQAQAGGRWLEASAVVRHDEHSQEGDANTTRLGLSAFPLGNDAWKVYGAYATGFRAPSLYELYVPVYGDDSLEAQESWSLEAGTAADLPLDLRLESAWFRTVYEQRIAFVWDPVTDPFFLSAGYENTTGQRIEGVENGVTWRSGLDGVRIRGAWTWLQDNQDGEALVNLPKNAVTISPGWYQQRWWAALELNAVSSRYGGADLPGYALLNANAGVRPVHWGTVYVRVINLTDRAYEEASGYSTPGLSFYLGGTASL